MKQKTRVLISTSFLVLLIYSCSPPPPPPPQGPQAFIIPEIEIKMVPIPAGTFWMGSSEDEAKWVADYFPSDNEKRHPVEISAPFWMSTLEITQKQWLSLTGIGIQALFDKAIASNGRFLEYGVSWVSFIESHFLKHDIFCVLSEAEEALHRYRAGISKNPYAPVACVNYEDALVFCQMLTDAERAKGSLPDGYVYSLPTEAQWEYACRAGTVMAFGGDVVKMDVFYKDDKISRGTPTGEVYPISRNDTSATPNKWGLIDMHGNLAEWCLDWYGPYPEGSSVSRDPTGPRTGEKRVIRGGSFDSSPAECRSASRHYAKPGARDIVIGFRVVLTPHR